MTDPTPIAILLSGNGSNFQALASAASTNGAFRIAGVLSDVGDAYGLQRARDLDIPTAHCQRRQRMSTEEHEQQMLDILASWSVSLVVLAGYMRILGPTMMQAWRGRLINIHPSLLPKYRGLHTYRRALEAGDREHGASAHYVTEELDGGPVIAQVRVAITASDTEQTLRAKVQAMEHKLYPKVIQALCLKHVTLDAETVRWHGQPLDEPLSFEELTK